MLSLLAGRVEAAPARPGAILVLAGGDGAPERARLERALASGLRIATRDLGCQVVVARDPPREPSVAELGRVEARGRAAGAALVVWLGLDDGEGVLFALRIHGGAVQRTLVGSDDPELSSRTLSLKVRALYASPLAERPPEWKGVTTPPGRPAKVSLDDEAGAARGDGKAPAAPPPIAAVPSAAPTKSAAGGTTDTATRATTVATPTALVTSAQVRPTRAAGGLELAVGYVLDAPFGDVSLASSLRQGVRGRLGWRTGRLPLSLHLESGWATTLDSTVQRDGATAAGRLWEIPVLVSLQLRLFERGRWEGAAGARAGLHAFHGAAEDSYGRSEAGWSYAGAAGLLVELRCLLGGPVALVLVVGGDVILPRPQLFRALGQPFADSGPFQLSATLGAVLRLD